MKLKRCAVLFIEPREELAIDWPALLAGGAVLAARVRWVALAPHLGHEVDIDGDELAVLGAIGQTGWRARDACERQFGQPVIARLLQLGLLVGDAPHADPAHARLRERDEVLRAQHWKPLSAAAHMFGRWEGMQVETGMRFPGIEELIDAYGPPPPPCLQRATAPPLALPTAAAGGLDGPLLERYTGRNYDAQAALPLAIAARLLQRSFGAQAAREIAPGATVLKKTSPSAGGLHPIEAYVLAVRVESIPCGLYHYRAADHQLAPLQALDSAGAAALALAMVAGQHWLAEAPLLVVLAARVARNFWKYRNHAKAYRALMLDAGHLSQTFYLLAAEAGMPAFVTAAINEADIEQACGLDPLADAVIAVCGCGPASGAAGMLELR